MRFWTHGTLIVQGAAPSSSPLSQYDFDFYFSKVTSSVAGSSVEEPLRFVAFVAVQCV